MHVLANLPADQNQYGFEYKWDGVRAIFFWDGSRADFSKPKPNDITELYPEIVEPLAETRSAGDYF